MNTAKKITQVLIKKPKQTNKKNTYETDEHLQNQQKHTLQNTVMTTKHQKRMQHKKIRSFAEIEKKKAIMIGFLWMQHILHLQHSTSAQTATHKHCKFFSEVCSQYIRLQINACKGKFQYFWAKTLPQTIVLSQSAPEKKRIAITL